MNTCTTCYSKYEKSEYNQTTECDCCYSVPDLYEVVETKLEIQDITRDLFKDLENI